MRTLLGRYTAIASRGAVYEAPDGLEIETADHYEILRQRVLWEDVLLVTLHRRIGIAFVIVNLAVVLFFAAMGVFFYMIGESSGAKEMWVPALIFGMFGSPFLLALLVRLIFRVDEVTVWGRRSHAAMRFTFRKGKARQLYEDIGAKVNAAQEQLRAQFAAEAAAAPAPPVVAPEDAPPMPPPLPPA